MLSICWEISLDGLVEIREVRVLRESLMISALFMGIDLA